MGNFERNLPKIQKWCTVVGLLLSVAIFILGCLFSGWLVALGLVMFAAAIAVDCLWVVPTGYIGYMTIFSKLWERSFSPGLNWLVPFVSDTYLMDTTVITKSITDTKKVKTRNDVTLEYTISYKLKERYVSNVFKVMRGSYWETHVAKWIDAVFDTFVSQLTYHEFQLMKNEIEQMASKLIQEEIDKKCVDMTTGMGFRNATRYRIVPVMEIDPDNPTKEIEVPDPADPSKTKTIEVDNLIPKVIRIEENGETEEVVVKTLEEYLVPVSGINFFEFVDLKINRVKFEDSYEQQLAKVAVTKAQTIQAKELAKQMEIQAEARKKAMIIEAEGLAEKMRLEGASENEVKAALGQILKEHPELLKQELAKHFPKVFGGSTMVNMGEMLGE
jgi:regulator of protease activity HflC (stomatin/prohibitin superfamily)